MDKGAISGSREPSQSALSRPIGFDPERMVELAERCEKAVGPDRELDAAIKEAVGHPWDYAADWGPQATPTGRAYTASLDAAMTLVPEGRKVVLDVFSDGQGKVLISGGRFFGSGDNPALAMCAAALRARAAAKNVQKPLAE